MRDILLEISQNKEMTLVGKNNNLPIQGYMFAMRYSINTITM